MPPRDFLRDLGKALNGRRISEADILTEWQVVRPYDSRGLTEVRKSCNEQSLIVGNVSGLTFAPGAAVMIGTHTGLPGRQIIAGAPPGRRGASLVPVEATSRTYGAAPEEEEPPPVPVCPVSLTGRSYLGIQDKASTSTLYAYLYSDGGYVSTLATKSYSGVFSSIRAGRMQRVHGAANETVIFGAQSAGLVNQIVTWDLVANTFAVLNTTLDITSGPLWTGGTDIYFSKFRTSPRGISLYKTTVGASGTLSLAGAIVGSALNDANLTVHSTSLCHNGGVTFEVPGATYSGSAAAPYFAAGAWNLGTGRTVLAGLASSSNHGGDQNGYSIAGGSLRITYRFGSPNRPTLGIMPAGPGTPETALINTDWETQFTVGQILNLSVSPSGDEFLAYMLVGGVGGRVVRLRVDEEGGYALAGCAVPYFTVASGPNGDPAYMLCRDN